MVGINICCWELKFVMIGVDFVEYIYFDIDILGLSCRNLGLIYYGSNVYWLRLEGDGFLGLGFVLGLDWKGWKVCVVGIWGFGV